MPKQVFVGRIPGKQLEADVDVPEGYRDVQGAAARYLAYHCLDSAATHLTEEGKDRFIIEDVQGEAAIIIVSATADMFGEFLPTAQKALDTFEWTSHRSTQTLLPDVGE